MSMQQAIELAEVCRGAATSVAAGLREVFRSNMDVEYKRDVHDQVTEHDRACEAAITDFLISRWPGARVVGEEFGAAGDGDVTFYIDPIDGTTNFVQGLAFFCTSVGAAVNGKLVAGAIYNPISDELFSADAEDAWLNGEKLVAKDALPAGAATLITGYPTAADFQADGELAGEIFADLVENFSSLRRTGSGALGLCHVAAGWTDAVLNASTSPWDVAAGIQILRNAGGFYQPLWYSRERGPIQDAPAYFATGPGGDYPALTRAAEKIVENRTKTG